MTARKMLLNGQRPIIDPRYRTNSVGEAALVDIIERAWEHDVDKRISVFEIIPMLRKAIEDHGNNEPAQQKLPERVWLDHKPDRIS